MLSWRSLPSATRMSCLSRKSKVGHWPTWEIRFDELARIAFEARVIWRPGGASALATSSRPRNDEVGGSHLLVLYKQAFSFEHQLQAQFVLRQSLQLQMQIDASGAMQSFRLVDCRLVLHLCLHLSAGANSAAFQYSRCVELTLEESYPAGEEVGVGLNRAQRHFHERVVSARLDLGPARELRQRTREAEARGRGRGLVALVEEATVALGGGQPLDVELDLRARADKVCNWLVTSSHSGSTRSLGLNLQSTHLAHARDWHLVGHDGLQVDAFARLVADPPAAWGCARLLAGELGARGRGRQLRRGGAVGLGRATVNEIGIWIRIEMEMEIEMRKRGRSRKVSCRPPWEVDFCRRACRWWIRRPA